MDGLHLCRHRINCLPCMGLARWSILGASGSPGCCIGLGPKSTPQLSRVVSSFKNADRAFAASGWMLTCRSASPGSFCRL